MESEYCTSHTIENNSIGIVQINSELFNAITQDKLKKLHDMLIQLDDDSRVKCIILTGTKEYFSVGNNIREMMTEQFTHKMKEKRRFGEWNITKNIKVPVIAAVFGYAFGGGTEIALYCDMIFCDTNATFRLPECSLGLLPGSGGTQRLSKLIGVYKALEIILTGKMIDSIEADKIGLVNKVLPSKELMNYVIEIAKKISKCPRATLIEAKSCVKFSQESFLSQGLFYEMECFNKLLFSSNGREGLKSFLEKREPVWTE